MSHFTDNQEKEIHMMGFKITWRRKYSNTVWSVGSKECKDSLSLPGYKTNAFNPIAEFIIICHENVQNLWPWNFLLEIYHNKISQNNVEGFM